jgi:mRNA export factor
MFGAAAAAPAANLNPNKDVQISPALQDGISSLAFSPRANILVATSWDNSAYCWEINAQTAQATAKASTSHSAPLLCCSWKDDGSGVFTGGCDKIVKLWDLGSNQSQQVAAHDAPIRHCAYIPGINLLVTGETGWVRGGGKESVRMC